MNILVIDDCRIMPFECIYSRNVEDAKDRLFEQDWDEVWFDHDLGETDVRPVVRWLEEIMHGKTQDDFDAIRIGKVYIHSDNPVGVKYIKQGLEKFYDVEVVSGQISFRVDSDLM